MAPDWVNCSLNSELTVPVEFAGFVTVMVWQPMTSVYVAPLPEQPFASVAVTTIGNDPVCVGVPERTPPVESVRPVGSVEAVVKVTVPIVLPAVKVCEKALDAVPVVVTGFVTLITWQPMVSEYVVPVPVQPFESVTFTTIGKVPVCVGVPERTPPLESVSPAGNVLAVENATAPIAPDCVKVWLNAAAATPVVVAGLITLMVWQPITSV